MATTPKSSPSQLQSALLLMLMLVTVIGGIAAGLYIKHLDDIVREKFEGSRWALPARVYARPLILDTKNFLAQQAVLDELAVLNYRQATAAKSPGTFDMQGNTLYLHTRGFAFSDFREPAQLLRLRFEQGRLAEVATTTSGRTGAVRLEPLAIGGIFTGHNEDRILVQLKQLPAHLLDALLAAEDHDFYDHMGVSLRGIFRAVWVNLTSGRVRQGGSTLTQQLVKNFYLSDERSIKRKVNEAIMAVLLEVHYDKSEILEAYINEVALGQQGDLSINGFGLAAQHYFGLPLSELSLPQVALLVGMVKGPSLYNPRRNPERALERRNIVLESLYREGKISILERDRAMNAALSVTSKPTATSNLYPDFMDVVRKELRRSYAAEDLSSQGLQIFTTLDPRVQNAAERAMATVVKSMRARGGPVSKLQGAIVVSDMHTGELQAIVGGVDLFTGYNRATDASRQVGSLLKPAIYLEAIASGQFTWLSPVNDAPITIADEKGKQWSPNNYDGISHGQVPMREALAKSYNQAAVQLGMHFGVARFVEQLRQLGMQGNLPAYPSLFLGALNRTPLEMNLFYQALLTGKKGGPQAIREVMTADGKFLQSYAIEREQVVAAEDVYVLQYGLRHVAEAGTAATAYQRLSPQARVMGKTGTTNDMRDSWFAGSAGNHLGVVWLGRDDNRPIELTGSNGALPVWTDMMARLQPVARPMPQPEAVSMTWLDPESGYLSSAECGGVAVPLAGKSRPEKTVNCAGGVPALINNMVDGFLDLFR